MAPIARVKLRWSGFIGGPGYSIFHFRDFGWDTEADVTVAIATAAAERVHSFAGALAGSIPYNTTLQVLSDVEVIEETTGELLTVVGIPTPVVINSVNANTVKYAAATGAVITWRTGGVRNGRRVRGRTFWVPMVSTGFSPDGTIDAGFLTAFQEAAEEITDGTGSPDLGVWARPTAIKDGNGVPTGGYNADGAWFVVTSYSVPDMSAVLRSRRD